SIAILLNRSASTPVRMISKHMPTKRAPNTTPRAWAMLSRSARMATIAIGKIAEPMRAMSCPPHRKQKLVCAKAPGTRILHRGGDWRVMESFSSRFTSSRSSRSIAVPSSGDLNFFDLENFDLVEQNCALGRRQRLVTHGDSFLLLV